MLSLIERLTCHESQWLTSAEYCHSSDDGEVVGTARFELATYGTQNRRATRLRYAPMSLSLAPLVGIEKRDFADHSSHGQVAVV